MDPILGFINKTKHLLKGKISKELPGLSWIKRSGYAFPVVTCTCSHTALKLSP